jgi:hypothetical protein
MQRHFILSLDFIVLPKGTALLVHCFPVQKTINNFPENLYGLKSLVPTQLFRKKSTLPELSAISDAFCSYCKPNN